MEFDLEKRTQFFVDGQWIEPLAKQLSHLINPANEEQIAVVSVGSANDIDGAVAAARKAFQTWSQTRVQERIELIQRLATVYESRSEEMAQIISAEMGAPISHARTQQAAAALGHIDGFSCNVGEF